MTIFYEELLELELDSELDDSLLDDSELDEDELEDSLDELDDPATPNISISAKYLSIHLASRPNRMGRLRRIIYIVEVSIFVQLNVTDPTFTVS